MFTNPTSQKNDVAIEKRINSNAHNSGMISTAAERLIKDTIQYDWTKPNLPVCKDSLIDYVQKEATDIVKAAAAGKSHLTTEEVWDATIKLFHLSAICLKENLFIVHKSSEATPPKFNFSITF